VRVPAAHQAILVAFEAPLDCLQGSLAAHDRLHPPLGVFGARPLDPAERLVSQGQQQPCLGFGEIGRHPFTTSRGDLRHDEPAPEGTRRLPRYARRLRWGVVPHGVPLILTRVFFLGGGKRALDTTMAELDLVTGTWAIRIRR